MSGDDNKVSKPDMRREVELPIASRTRDEGFWRELWFQIRLVWHLIRSPDVPLYLKILPALAVIYVLVPTDLMPDVFPVIGQLDDITAILVGAKVFIELSPQDVVERMRQTMRRQSMGSSAGEGSVNGGERVEDAIIIDGEYDFTDDGQ